MSTIRLQTTREGLKAERVGVEQPPATVVELKRPRGSDPGMIVLNVPGYRRWKQIGEYVYAPAEFQIFTFAEWRSANETQTKILLRGCEEVIAFEGRGRVSTDDMHMRLKVRERARP